MLVSAPFLLIGIASAVLVGIIETTQEVSEEQVQKLLLNIDRKDYDKGDFTNIKPDNNFIVIQNFNHEINSEEALVLLEIAKAKGIEVKTTKQANYFGIDRHPKRLFKDCMDMLWNSTR